MNIPAASGVASAVCAPPATPGAGAANAAQAGGAAEVAESARAQHIYALLGQVPDPEIPVLSIVDLGIVRHVRADAAGRLEVGLTPTYSGCPATEAIHSLVRAALDAAGCADVAIGEVLFPAWSSDWVTAAGREKLRRYGIAPPQAARSDSRQSRPVTCPRCASGVTARVSEFGSTPCKAHYVCRACGEPFDYFKCL